MKIPFEPQDNLNLGEIGHCLFSRSMTKIHFLSPRLILMGGGGRGWMLCTEKHTTEQFSRVSRENEFGLDCGMVYLIL